LRRPRTGQSAEIIAETEEANVRTAPAEALVEMEKRDSDGLETGRAMPGKRKDFHGIFMEKELVPRFRKVRDEKPKPRY
jgi:hypothetical protein